MSDTDAELLARLSDYEELLAAGVPAALVDRLRQVIETRTDPQLDRAQAELDSVGAEFDRMRASLGTDSRLLKQFQRRYRRLLRESQWAMDLLVSREEELKQLKADIMRHVGLGPPSESQHRVMAFLGGPDFAKEEVDNSRGPEGPRRDQ